MHQAPAVGLTHADRPRSHPRHPVATQGLRTRRRYCRVALWRGRLSFRVRAAGASPCAKRPLSAPMVGPTVDRDRGAETEEGRMLRRWIERLQRRPAARSPCGVGLHPGSGGPPRGSAERRGPGVGGDEPAAGARRPRREAPAPGLGPTPPGGGMMPGTGQPMGFVRNPEEGNDAKMADRRRGELVDGGSVCNHGRCGAAVRVLV